jgi:hypothetical protein
MSLLNSLVSAMDQFVHGQLTKAELVVLKGEKTTDVKPDEKLQFQFNPETITIKRTSNRGATNVTGAGNTGASSHNSGENAQTEQSMVLKNIVFDTYEQKPSKSVYDVYIEKLEKFSQMDRGKHAQARLAFSFGKFGQNRDERNPLKCWLDAFDVEYTMFLNDGTPVRAKVNLNLIIGETPEEQQEHGSGKSPDHAKMWTVRRGDTLAAIAHKEYDNPGEWRRIADANGIDDPMSLKPGTKLIVPPILG